MDVLHPTPVTTTDRLGLTLFFAVALHIIFILGITFSPTDDDALKKQPPLEITLVHQKSDKAPDKAEFLAQANLEGGGNTPEKVRHTSPASTFTHRINPGTAEALAMPTSPPKQQLTPETTALTQQDKSAVAVKSQTKPAEIQIQALSAAELVERSIEIAALSAEIDQSMQAYSERLKHRFITTRTREFRYAIYLDAWRSKIERIGTLNYPEDARIKNLKGNLILDVAINSDGTVHSITLRKSSGKKTLDDAAVRIVKLAAPFAPFPEALREDTDVLHITRTWQFLRGNRLQTQ